MHAEDQDGLVENGGALMARRFSATIDKWSDRALRNAKLIILEAGEITYNRMTEVQASVKDTGGVFVEGKVPVDIGDLINSTRVEINGSVRSEGGGGSPADFVGSVLGIPDGATIAAYFTIWYAPHVENGTRKMPGRFFIRNAVRQWGRTVSQVARKYK